ncbi:MAG: hypothetical protein ACI9OF_002805, partial [Saprospiraceae bacterium]
VCNREKLHNSAKPLEADSSGTHTGRFKSY